MVMIIGKRQIQGVIRPRVRGQESEQNAILDQQHQSNVLTLNAASIAPGEHITVKLSLTLPIDVSHQKMQLRLPTTLTPRFADYLTGVTATNSTKSTARKYIPIPRISVDGRFDSSTSIRYLVSPTHDLEMTDTGFHVSTTPMYKDILLEWPMTGAEKTTAKAFVTDHDGERYVQILVNPPSPQSTSAIKRELVFVIDKSGSMAGVSLNSAREVLITAIDGLQSEDTFNFIAFDHDYYPLFPSSKIASAENKYRARQYVDALKAEGGTELHDVLSFALNDHKQTDKQLNINSFETKPKRLKQVVFLTDGSVGYEDRVLKQIKKNIGDTRLFTVGIGPAPNRWFIEKAASLGRGTSLIIRNPDDAAGHINELLTGLESPVLTDINVNIPDSQQPYSTETHEMTAANAPAVAMHWARQKIESLLVDQLYSFDADLHKEHITQIALDTGLVTPYTKLIAVDYSISTQSLQPKIELSQLIQEGDDMDSVQLPPGTSEANTWTLFSFLSATAGVLMMFFSRIPWLSNRDVLSI